MNQELRDRIAALGEEAGRIFTQLLTDPAPSAPGLLDGLQVSVKDNIDTAGYTNAAASRVFRDRPPADADAPVVKRLREAGAVVFARTNMSEFAYSTHGINPHTGTPANPAYDDSMRIPGGSSSGAAVAVARGLGDAAIGTDTAGSVRIPAALCGVVGFKPRQRRISLEGIVPLSHSLDCVGMLARTAPLIARVFASISDDVPNPLSPPVADRRFRIVVPSGPGSATDGPHDESVLAAFQQALNRLERSSRFEIVTQPLPVIAEALSLSSDGGISAPEAFAFHKQYLQQYRHLYDPFTLFRLGFGERCSAERYDGLIARRRELMARALVALAPFDAVAFPTCPIVAPRVADVSAPDVLAGVNAALLRNTITANVLDLGSITLPCGHLFPSGEGPVGLSLDSIHPEEALLEVAFVAEQALAT